MAGEGVNFFNECYPPAQIAPHHYGREEMTKRVPDKPHSIRFIETSSGMEVVLSQWENIAEWVICENLNVLKMGL